MQKILDRQFLEVSMSENYQTVYLFDFWMNKHSFKHFSYKIIE